ncbi:hypothetical protein LCGC14_0900940 [marine sediment metagenome]|uniref:Uncharacterized protein n=1 Tax=marine sediment metagenome TaxID=412755 RepID=A0A0F9S3E2_9ZZZZ
MTMRRYKLVPTESFVNLVKKVRTDDIAVALGFEGQPAIIEGLYHEFIVDLGDGHEAFITVSEKTVEERPEYFKYDNVNI